MLGRIADGSAKVALIGLGYVGLPLAVAFGRKFDTVGFDVKTTRIEELKNGRDGTLETSPEELASAEKLHLSNSPEDLRGRDFYIVAVPTPVDRFNTPDLTPLYRASETVGKVIAPGAVVIFESTVYPGCTEEQCVPVIERESGLVFNRDFFCGYSPERINPGDREHTLERIVKITSGSTPETADAVDALYRSVVKAGTFRASSLKVAEAAKVIENSQRDLNIAFVNELAKIFRLIGIDTREVLEAAGTKWNFLKFQPGLVGGHCIGVDPYYLTHKATELGYHPEVILAGRRINDSMGRYAATETIKLMIRNGGRILGARVLQLGITFKENCPDIRNSRAADVAKTLAEFGCKVDVCDPWADPDEVKRNYELSSFRSLEAEDPAQYEAVVLAVAHDEFRRIDPRTFRKNSCVIYDIKGLWPRELVDGRL
ncbi:nucleotide sugar dehydrogenase [uncultured Victivallis sp.]|uniref:nucleotide sugar dehydrogenase n=1 Tax=uncultured Victivallis sp. TaxID=354118 RepID=UPI0025D56169|nr:nucleotide sugar dehydrogenase [uncultured Victivallis sp.]